MTANAGRVPERERCQQAHERREHTNLDVRYGAIGIASVASALRYTAPDRRLSDAPKAPRIEARFIEDVA